jgi:hypothetical protein
LKWQASFSLQVMFHLMIHKKNNSITESIKIKEEQQMLQEYDIDLCRECKEVILMMIREK